MKINKSQGVLLTILFCALSLDAILWWPSAKVSSTSLKLNLKENGLPYSADFVQPIPATLPLDQRKVELGKKLFFDKRLSDDNSISCVSCHVLSSGGSDNLPLPIGMHGAKGTLNTPTVFNVAFNFSQFWDGRATTLEEQLDAHVLNPKELASNWAQIIQKLNQDVQYRADFKAAFPDQEISAPNIRLAIAAFERSLFTPHSRFDQYLSGKADALMPQEIHGYELFKSYGCDSCHQGVNLGGNMYERIGLMADYFVDRNKQTEADNGRYNVTKDQSKMHFFKVPGLRNVGLTAPYFHDGSVASLPDAVRIMARYQIGKTLPENEIDDIVSFLFTLTGDNKFEGRAP